MKNQEDELEIEGCGHQECGRFDPTWRDVPFARANHQLPRLRLRPRTLRPRRGLWVCAKGVGMSDISAIQQTMADQINELRAERDALKSIINAVRDEVEESVIATSEEFDNGVEWEQSQILAILEGKAR